jgi:acetylglutamate/LysW-gamma-L-alpha-aminoadipate kinase
MLVIKIGGGTGINLEALAKNLVQLQKSGKQVVVVTGANAKLSQTQKERGIEPKMITSERGEKSRFTDEVTLELLKEVYGGVADEVAQLVNENGGAAVSQLASQDNLILAKRHERMRVLEPILEIEGNGATVKINLNNVKFSKDADVKIMGKKVKVIDGDLTGKIEKVDSEKIQKILDSKKILVITPPAATENSTEVNVDGDKIASKIAVELKADKLIFFSNTPGLLENVENEESLIKEIPIAEADKFAVGRMKKKILAAKRAIEAGVKEVIFADGRMIKNPIEAALAGGGTKVF